MLIEPVKSIAAFLMIALTAVNACGASVGIMSAPVVGNEASTNDAGLIDANASGKLPLVLVADVDLPGPSSRFDYQDINPARGQLVIAHMNNASVLITNLADGSVLKELSGIPTPRGIAVAPDVGRIFVTSSPGKVVIIDDRSLTEIKRVTTGTGPDGIAWDPTHQMVGVSDQGDGALSIIANAGDGARKSVPLGAETGNVVYDTSRGWFWITVVAASPPDKLVGVDPTSSTAVATIPLLGCDGAHGLRLHPDGQSAFIACEGNNTLARVNLEGQHELATAPTGSGPDVLSIDPKIGWLYVAAETGDLTVFDIAQLGVSLIGYDNPGAHSHSVAADPATQRVFFPLLAGPRGTPVLRIMRPGL